MNSEYLFYYSLWFWCMFDLIYNCWSRSCFSFYIFYFLSIFSYYFDLLNYSACWLYIIAHSYLFGWIRLSDCFLLLCKLLNYSDWCCSKMLDYINKINFIFLTCDFMYKSILSLKKLCISIGSKSFESIFILPQLHSIRTENALIVRPASWG